MGNSILQPNTSWPGVAALDQLWSRYGSDKTVREDTAGLV
jgi:hypothetical protein